jgi:hypothetical protein
VDVTSSDSRSDTRHDPFEHGPVIPEGYVRGSDGRWRYAVGNDHVPGARDACLERLWRFPLKDGFVLVPVETAEAADELQWCRDWAHGRVIVERRRGRPAHEAWMVPAEEWHHRSRIPLGIDAPELSAGRLVGVGAIARLAGVEEASVRAWAARGVLPAPVLPTPPGPAWSLPVVLRVLSSRAGQGKRPTQATRRPVSAPRRTAPAQPSVSSTLAEQMRHLDMLRKRSQEPATRKPDPQA